jgi:hypothetical protein
MSTKITHVARARIPPPILRGKPSRCHIVELATSRPRSALIYAKAQKEDLTADEKKTVRKLAALLKR